MLGWTDDRIRDWLSRLDHVLDNEFLDHDDAGWYVEPLMIPEELRRTGDARVHSLRVRISQALHAA